MNAINKLPLSNTAAPSKNGHPTDFTFAPPKRGARNDGFLNRLLLAAVLIMTGVFIWTCWNFIHAPQTQPIKWLLAVIGSLAVCLLASAAAVGTLLWSRHTSAKNARLMQGRDLLLRTLIDNLPDAIYAKDTAGRKILANLADVKNIRRNTETEVIGKSDFDLFPQELAEKFYADDQKVIQGHAVINREEYLLNEAGEKRWLMTTKLPLHDQTGKIVGLVGIGRDITEHKLMEEALAQERSLLRTLIDNLPDAIYAKDTAGRKTLVNLADLKNICCETEAEVIGKNDFDLFPKEIAEKFYADDQKVIQGEAVIDREEYLVNKDGKKRWLMTSKLPLHDQTGKIVGLVGIGRDITEHKLAEAALRESQALHHSLVTQLPVGVFRKDQQGRYVLVNPEYCQLKGMKAEEFLGKTPAEVRAGEEAKPGAPELATKYANQAEDHHRLIMQTGRPVELDEEYSLTGGRKLFVHAIKFPVLDPDGKIVGTQGILFDITERKQAEDALHQSEGKLRQFTAQLEQSNRELQDFAYVASHDLQEPLRKIVVFGERLKEKCGETLEGEPRDYLERMQKAAARMQTLINDLLTFSRVTSKAHPFLPVDLNKIAHEVAGDLEARIEQVKGQVEIGKLPVIDADELQMRQLLQNLIGNALKFRRPEVPPVVKVAVETIAGDSGQKLCQLTVSDNGIGFDEKYLDRIFTVFQRLHTRGEYEGTGMGLAIVKKIALYHGGSITASSKPGHGATFIVTLPVVHPKKEVHNN